MERKMERKYGVDQLLIGRLAECDGGGPVRIGQGSRGVVGGRECFRGRLTGMFLEQGDPPWIWYQMGELEVKPENYSEEFVWCEKDFVFFMDDK
jgi:hypothetical protein